MKTWHGEENIADVVVDAGQFGDPFKKENMFDKNSQSYWFSSNDYNNKEKNIEITFKV